MREFTTATAPTNDRSRDFHEIQIATASTVDSNSKRELDRRLDRALEDTFPASDPVSIVISARNG